MSYSTDGFQAPKGAKKDLLTPLAIASMPKRERFRLMLRDYGGTLLALHITFSLICLGCCYMVVIRSVTKDLEIVHIFFQLKNIAQNYNKKLYIYIFFFNENV